MLRCQRRRAVAFLCGWHRRLGAASAMARHSASPEVACRVVRLAFGDVLVATVAEEPFKHPCGVAVNGAGDLLVSDALLRQVLVVRRADGAVQCLAGAEAQLRFPRGIAVDATGAVVVCDQTASALRKLEANRRAITLELSGSCRQLNNPFGVAITHANDLIVADTRNHCIKLVDTKGAEVDATPSRPLNTDRLSAVRQRHTRSQRRQQAHDAAHAGGCSRRQRRQHLCDGPRQPQRGGDHPFWLQRSGCT
eukprot:TRINITY_DN4517_c0_g1_i5.p1 TRINITY_DN4517_c0_g1~~TRINITY_DN4517_c0_g1_i5.p1  ORF type:complete len:251 (+),score=19.29 TRINITY_DN4517_c0_g1_i5:18-770(+)